MEIVVCDPAEMASFLADHVREMEAVVPPESQHALDLQDLRAAEVAFWAAIEEEEVVGVGAIKKLEDGHGEIKSMRVDPALRGRGVASRLLRHLLTDARRKGFSRLSLETGSSEFFEPARRLYLKHGFDLCGPFGDYEDDPNSVYMTKRL